MSLVFYCLAAMVGTAYRPDPTLRYRPFSLVPWLTQPYPP
jgi:hypothetical protein